MPTFEEKCPEFGQKIRVNVRCEDLVFLRYDCGNYICHSETFTYYYKSEVKWTPTSEEPQWTQITEDESTWPNCDEFLLNDSLETTIFRKIPGFRYQCDKQKGAWSINGMLKWKWIPMPKAPETKKEESSPWISTDMKPIHGNEVLVRSKLSTGEFIYGIGCIFKGDWSWSNCSRPEEWMEIPK